MFQDVCFTSIQALCQLENCISAPSQSHITPSTSQDVHLHSIQVPSQPHPGLEICVSSPPRLPDSRVFFVSVKSYLNLGPDIYISPTVTSHLHPGPPNCILVPSKHHLKPIQVSRCVSHLHPCPSSTGSRSQDSILTTAMYCLSSIQVHRFPSHLHPGRVSPPCRC